MNPLQGAGLRPLVDGRCAVALMLIFAVFAPAAWASNLVTGNGFGFAVVRPESGSLSHFYVHPYCFARRDALEPLGEGIATTDLIQSLGWPGEGVKAPTVTYERNSHIVRSGNAADESVYFMPFGLNHAALVIDRETMRSAPSSPGWQVTWRHPLKSRLVRHVDGLEFIVLSFAGVQESLLLIPLSAAAGPSPSEPLNLDARRAWILVAIEEVSEQDATVREVRQWQAGLSPRELAQREIQELERWRVRPAVQFGRAAALASERSAVAHGAEPRAEPTRTLRQRAHRGCLA